MRQEEGKEQIWGKYRGITGETTSKSPLSSSPPKYGPASAGNSKSLTHIRDHGCTHHCVGTSLGRRNGYHSMRGDTVVVDVFPLVLRPVMVSSILILK